MNLPRRDGRRSRAGWAAAVALAGVAALLSPARAPAVDWPWETDDYDWPEGSDLPVEPLDRPAAETAVAEAVAAEGLFRFAAFGDQRALADGEWQQLMRHIVEWERDHGDLAFVIDTGDIVNDGRHTDQFHRLTDEILAIAPELPYLVGVGNHEVHNNEDPAARAHTAAYLRALDPRFSAERMYYRKDLGGATFLFLDTNDLVYGDAGERGACPPELEPGSRAAAQMDWLTAQLAEIRAAEPRPVIAVLHHPFVQSSAKHRESAASLWNLRVDGTPFADLLVDGGVDVVLTGHTHTYERFHLHREDGARLDVVNLSGRPRGSAFGLGAGLRRSRDIRGEERERLADWDWQGLERWTITQAEYLPKDQEADQFAVFTVEPGGALTMEVRFLGADDVDGTTGGPVVRLR